MEIVSKIIESAGYKTSQWSLDWTADSGQESFLYYLLIYGHQRKQACGISVDKGTTVSRSA